MKGKYGVAMNIYHTRIPHQGSLRKGVILSREAKLRLKWFDYYNSHNRNARLTCRHFGISPTTFYKWLKRYKPYKLQTLESRSRRPRRVRSPQVDWEIVQRVVELREENPGWSKYKLGVLIRGEGFKVSDSTIGRILVRKGLNHRIRKSQPQKRAIRRIRVPNINRKIPGSLVQVDVKYLVVTGRTFYQFTAIDVVTRLKYSQIYSTKGSLNGKRFVKELINKYPFKIQAIQTDNGSEFLRHFHQECIKRGIKHYFSHPKSPKENAYVERVIQTDSYEFWYQGNMVNDMSMMRERMKIWNQKYNYERPHQSLGMQTPWQYYQTLALEQKGGDDIM
jgi:transposase InsO family protein